MKVDLWRFTKRNNSLRIPDFDPGCSFECYLKDSTNITKPTIELHEWSHPTYNPARYNYAYIADFNRYYYITDWIFNRGIWECTMEVDVLASWRDKILDSECYVLRSSNVYKGAIMDTMYPTAEIDIKTEYFEDYPWARELDKGSYIVGIINGDTATFGAVSYYVFNPPRFRMLCESLFGSIDWMGVSVQEISTELLKSLFNPFQYIVSVMYIPIHFETLNEAGFVGDLQKLKYGWWEVDTLVQPLKKAVWQQDFSIAIPKHPQYSAFGKFVGLEPYSKYSLYFPGFGDIPLDGGQFWNEPELDFTLRVDLITGRAMLYASAIGDIAEHHYAQIGVSVQIAQISTDVLGTAANAISAVSSTVGSLFSLDFGGAVANAASGIASTINSAIPQLRTSGSNGSLVEVGMIPRIRGIFYKLVDRNSEDWGNPVCERGKLSNYQGFVKTANCHIQINGYKTEADEINRILQEGFFNE